jgi:hypothetical protein
MRKMRLAVGLVLAAAALAWTPPERVDRKPEDYRTHLRALAVGRDGTIHVVWSETRGSEFLEKIMHSRRQGDTWTIPVNISRDSGDIRVAAIVLDSEGRALVVWSEESYARMRYVRQLGDTWSVPKLCFPNNGIAPRLALDSRGRIHLLFEELGGQDAIWYSQYMPAGDSWATPSLVADDEGSLGRSDLAVDSRDWLRAVWMNWGTYGIDYSHNDGSGWSEPVALPDPAPEGQSCDPRIACDAAGCPHVVWQERWGWCWIYHSTLSSDTWTTPFRVYDTEGGRPAVCCDDAGRVHVIWHWAYGMRYRTLAADSWLEPGVVSPTGGSPQVVAVRSLLHLVFRDEWRIFYSRHDASGIEEEPQRLEGQGGLSVAVSAHELRLGLLMESPGQVLVQVLDSAGRVRACRSGIRLDAGYHELTVPIKDLASGAYLCRVTTGSEIRSAKLTIIR